MPSVEVSIWLALKAHISSLTLSPAVPVVLPKENAPSTQHIRVRHLINANQRPFHGSDDDVLRKGILQLSLMSVLVSQVAEVDMEIAGQIAAHFAQDTPLRSGGVTVKVDRPPDVAQAFRDQNWWHTPVSVNWYAFA